tara:strand:+ start:412 stop:642 length:231 start_codon:yes stop_codon:yes gene_type:complete
MSDEKTIFIRCSGETKALLKAIKKAENRSENAQVIHMIHKEAERLGVSVEEEKKEEVAVTTGLSGLAETVKSGNLR